MRTRRGVTLIEGMVATVILLVGMVGVFQGMIVASLQNASANRRTRAAAIAAETTAALEQLGRANVINAGGALLPIGTSGLGTLAGDLQTELVKYAPASLPGYLGATYLDVDNADPNNPLVLRTPGYGERDAELFERVVAVYVSDDLITRPVVQVNVSVGWREAGRWKVVNRLTSFYDTSQQNLVGMVEY